MVNNLIRRFEDLGTALDLPAGTMLFHQGEPALEAFLVRSGAVCMSLVGTDGMPVWSRTVRAGALVGLAATIANQPHTLDAIAVQKTALQRMDRSHLADIIEKDSSAAADVLYLLSLETLELRRKMPLLLTTQSKKRHPYSR